MHFQTEENTSERKDLTENLSVQIWFATSKMKLISIINFVYIVL